MNSCKKNEEETPPIAGEIVDPDLSQVDQQILEGASIKLDDYLDSLYDINGVSYRTLFNDSSFINQMDSLVVNFKTSSGSVSDQIKSDLNMVLTRGAYLVHYNENPANIRPQLSNIEPRQQAYGYLQVKGENRQLSNRVFPEFGNSTYKTTYKFIGTDCSGYIEFCLKSAGFPGNITFSVGQPSETWHFSNLISKSVAKKYNNNAELINLGRSTQIVDLKPGDFMVSEGHIAIINIGGNGMPTSVPIAFNSNGTTKPASLDNHKTNFEYPTDGILKRGICAKNYYNLIDDGFMGLNTNIYRIVPIIDKAQKISGDNQQGVENTVLPQPLKVKILDKLGFGIEGLGFSFTVLSGGGSIVSGGIGFTDSDGIAAASWQLGMQSAGIQKVKVEILNFKSQPIPQSSLEFTASFGGGCGTPDSLLVLAGSSSANLYWGAVNGATSYNIQYNDAAYTWNATIPGAGTYAYIDGLDPSTSYSFKVQANCNGSLGAYSNSYSFSTNIPNGGQGCGAITSLTDVDGNSYSCITIGTQCWMKENLKVSRYRNGDSVSTGLPIQVWQSTNNGACSVYNNSSANDSVYGKLYNWYAVADSRRLCPSGWHVASQLEWSTLETFLGGFLVSGGKMKAISSLWITPNIAATNSSGFTGLPGGYINGGSCLGMGSYGSWWTSTSNTSYSANYRVLSNSSPESSDATTSKNDGKSIRCVKN